MTLIVKHLPAIQVLIPLFGALLSTMSFNRKVAEIIAIIVAICSFFLSIYQLSWKEISYTFGDWQVPIGIEYRLDFLNQPLIIFINLSLLFFLIFCKSFTEETIILCIKDRRQFLFYSILLFAHMGYVGMASTNDLFNLYVFIEISSLSIYVLMAQGQNSKALQGAFYYLMLGSIGATLILIGIGFLLSYTGTLNITDIKLQLAGRYYSKIVIVGSSFILLGTILKMAFFPLHLWMIKAYNSAPTIILTYLASISGITGTYIFLRFIHFSLDYNEIISPLALLLKPISLITILSCSFIALKLENLKKIVIYSVAAQTGYLILLLSIPNNEPLIFQFLIIDGINKISLFLIIAQQEKTKFKYNNCYLYFAIIILICSAGLPLSGMFILKLSILEMLIQKNLWLEFVVIILGSILTLLYHYKIAKEIFKHYKSKLKTEFAFNREVIGMISLSALQIVVLTSSNWVIKYNIWDSQKFVNSPIKIIKKQGL